MPLALSTGTPDPDTGQQELLFKDTGDQTTQPARKTIKPASNATPDYRLSIMFGANAGLVVLDAISSGNDQICYDSTGLFQGDAMGGWATLAVTVDHTAVGVGNGPVSERRANNFNVGADVYSFAADNSLGIDDGLKSEPMLEIPREAVSLPANIDIQTIVTSPMLMWICHWYVLGAAVGGVDVHSTLSNVT